MIAKRTRKRKLLDEHSKEKGGGRDIENTIMEKEKEMKFAKKIERGSRPYIYIPTGPPPLKLKRKLF